jgi:tetratricopeptide (TPR) repeat protein
LAEDRPLFVAREEDVNALLTHWNAAKTGQATAVRLVAPFGGGRRAVCGELLRQIQNEAPEAVLWRVTCLDQENGLQWLVRMYGALIATLTLDAARKGRIELLLAQALPAQPKRVQGWYQEFITALKESKTDREKGAVQLRMPKDNPLIGLVEITIGIARKQPVVLEIQNPYSVYSVAMAQFAEALLTEAKSNEAKLLIILHDEPAGEATSAMHPMPLLDFYNRRADEIAIHPIAAWGEAESAKFLESKGLSTSNAARIAEIATGRPGFIAELVEILEARNLVEGDLSATTFSSLVPRELKLEDLAEGAGATPEEGKRKVAGADDLGRIAYLGALLGQAFPAGLVADMGGFDRDSVDDLLDAASMFEEVQFAEELGTWIYKFEKGSWREGILEENNTDEGHDLARRVGLFMERFLVPRGPAFIARTARVYAENGAGARANVMRSLALSNDAPDVWGLGYDLARYFDEVQWPDALKRTLYMNLLDRMVVSGDIRMTEQVLADATEWATKKEDRELTAWLLFAGSRLDARRSDLYRARDRARDALSLYKALGNNARQAEIHNHLAGLEVQDGNRAAAVEHVEEALELGKVDGQDGQKVVLPGILANAELLKGLVARNSSPPKLQEAAQHFQRANEIAGQVGIAQLAFDAGLRFGEALLAGNQTQQARDVLERVVQIARQLRNNAGERNATELLAQAEGALRNYAAALPLAERTLELSKALRIDHALPIDNYNVGFFYFANQKPTEALAYFRQSAEKVDQLGQHPMVKELWFYTGMAHLAVGNREEGRQALRASLRPAQQAKDWKRMVSALDQLAGVEVARGDKTAAKKYLTDAIAFAEKGNLREERRSLRQKLTQIGT